MYSVNFLNCRYIYPIRCVRPLNKYKYSESVTLKKVVQSITNSNCQIDDAIFDNPKRSLARCALSHSAKYACEYCEEPASSFVDNSICMDVDKNVKKLQKQQEDIQNKISFIQDSAGSVKSKKKMKVQLSCCRQFRTIYV